MADELDGGTVTEEELRETEGPPLTLLATMTGALLPVTTWALLTTAAGAMLPEAAGALLAAAAGTLLPAAEAALLTAAGRTTGDDAAAEEAAGRPMED